MISADAPYNKRSLRDISLSPRDSVVVLVPLPQSLLDGVLVRHVRIRRLGGDLVPEAGLAVATISLRQMANVSIALAVKDTKLSKYSLK